MIVSLNEGWQADYNATTLFPQQSCSKLWVAITAMDAVDKGRVSLNDKVTLGRDDLTLFHQPIKARVLGKGGHTTTLGNLLFTAVFYAAFRQSLPRPGAVPAAESALAA